MDADTAKIEPEAILEKDTRGGIEGPPWRREDILHRRRRRQGRLTLGSAEPALHSRSGTGQCPSPASRWFRHPHHLLRHPIGLLFEPIVGTTDDELGLQCVAGQSLVLAGFALAR